MLHLNMLIYGGVNVQEVIRKLVTVLKIDHFF